MSLESWAEEFFPDGFERVKRAADISDQVAAAHAARKWRGFLPENLHRHKTNRNEILNYFDRSPQSILGSPGCALCVRYRFPYSFSPDCRACPLYEKNGNQRCGSERDYSRDLYTAAFSYWDIRPLVHALEEIARTSWLSSLVRRTKLKLNRLLER